MHLPVISVLLIFISTICALPSHNIGPRTNVHQYAKIKPLSFHIQFKPFYEQGYNQLGPPPKKLDQLPSQASNPSVLKTLWKEYRQESAAVAGKGNEQAFPLIVHVNNKQVVIKRIVSSKVEDVIFEIHAFERLGTLVAWADIGPGGLGRFGKPRYLIVLECNGCVPASRTTLLPGQLKTLNKYAESKILLQYDPQHDLGVSEDSWNYAYQQAGHRDENAVSGWRACYLGHLTRKS